MAWMAQTLTDAWAHAGDHRAEIGASAVCGCFYGCATFGPGEIERWLNEGSGTALCPHCQIDSAPGSASGYPAGEIQFLRAMHARWFETSTPA